MWLWFVPGLGALLVVSGGLSAFTAELPSLGPFDDALVMGGMTLTIIGLLAVLRRFVHSAQRDLSRG